MIGVFDHPWLSGLFSDDEAQALWSAERQVLNMLQFEAAYSRALGASGIVLPETAEAASAIVIGFTPNSDVLRAGTAKDGLPVPALIAELRKAAGDLAPAIHTGATSQDVMDSALALTLRDMLGLLDRRLEAVERALDGLRRKFGSNQMMGRTRMQAALPITVADRLAAWASPLPAHRARLAEAKPRIARLQFGGAVGDRQESGQRATEIARFLATELDLVEAGIWHSARDGVAEFAGLLSLITGSLGKIGQDLCLMSQQGVDEVTLSGGGGSSAMPHKQNPILAELLVTLARFNAVQLSGIHQALVHEQERSGSAWALEWMILPQMAVATARALAVTVTLCESVTDMGKSA